MAILQYLKVPPDYFHGRDTLLYPDWNLKRVTKRLENPKENSKQIRHIESQSGATPGESLTLDAARFYPALSLPEKSRPRRLTVSHTTRGENLSSSLLAHVLVCYNTYNIRHILYHGGHYLTLSLKI